MEEAMTPENIDGFEVETTKATPQTGEPEGGEPNVNLKCHPEVSVPARKGILRGASAEKEEVVLGKAQISFNATPIPPGPTARAPLDLGAGDKVRYRVVGILTNYRLNFMGLWRRIVCAENRTPPRSPPHT